MFASAFGSPDQQSAMKQYYEWFEKKEEPPDADDYEEFIPETEEDVQQMINEARRAGVIV